MLLLLAALAAAQVAVARGGERLLWSEEFNSLDSSVWEHLVTAWRGGNQEFEYYRDSRNNSYVREGVLYIRPTLTADEYGEKTLYSGELEEPGCNMDPCVSSSGEDITLPVLSARMRTIHSFGFRYGRLEVRAQMPRGDWIWPAIWLKPVENAYGPWPSSGEIDLVELRGNRKLTTAAGKSMGVETMGSTLHFGPNRSYNLWRPTHWERSLAGTGKDFADDFHLYGLEWTEESLSFTLDGQLVGSVTPPEGGFWELGHFDQDPGGRNLWENGTRLAPFDRKFFLILNVAVGGTFFPNGLVSSPCRMPWRWDSAHPMRDFWEGRGCWLGTWKGEDAAMKVDYLRVYVPDG